MGQSCSGGCSPGEICAIEDDGCARGICLVDTRSGLETYCSALCTGTDCPEGFACVEETVSLTATPQRACVAEPAVCGDGARQLGEACDDGNTSDGDLCSFDCTETTAPPGFAWTVDIAPVGGGPIAFHGEADELVSEMPMGCGHAHRVETGMSGGVPAEAYDIVLCDGAYEATVRAVVPLAATTGAPSILVHVTTGPECQYSFFNTRDGITAEGTVDATAVDDRITGTIRAPLYSFPIPPDGCPELGVDEATIELTYVRSGHHG